ncbi:carboxymuconolactone decarboxylase [Ruegeria sp. ANG-S4]|uniref:carboxymuconolactone decarboxylase family protein n=1 Tax=Ruegeria sp. ANG-S4 TaxID=1577904 RepID=UPI00057E47C2|nr:carboxymuconolactone decarboxylase family protein [Ruegeria sp. ANG-S4]KIC43597.1 carboxymuconolactone decarboxylase [Ruegeria sp. ANG-S4]
MTTYSQHTVDTAPEGSKPILSAIKRKMGFVPNLMATMAESPVLVESYMTMMGIFEKTDLTPTEREIILMTNNRLNGCTYCMAAHTAMSKMSGVDNNVIEALRAGTPISDPKLEALRNFAEIMNETRGWASDAQVNALIKAGYSKQTVLNVIAGTALKVLSNYTTHIVNPPLDKAFEPMAWTPKTDVVAE